MINNDAIKDYILKELARNKGRDILDESDNLLETNIIDSLGIMKLVPFIEQTFSININDYEIVPENFESIIAITLFVQQKLK